ncbi:hypothetical protein OIU78_010872, partial [Salix suchowensis]
MALIPSNCTGLGKFLAWLEQMVLASPLLSKFWLENSNLIWADSPP